MADPVHAQPSRRVICICLSYGCRTKTHVNQFGEIQPGQLVSPTTRTKHRAKDNAELVESTETVCSVSFPAHMSLISFLISRHPNQWRILD
jgi:hypothetical protein